MNIADWLDAEKGRTAALSAHFAITPAAVSQWRSNGVPRDRIRAVSEFTGGVVTLEDMLPIDVQPESKVA